MLNRSHIPSGFFLSPGLYLGASFSFWKEEHIDPGLENLSGLNVQPFAMIELKLRFEF